MNAASVTVPPTRMRLAVAAGATVASGVVVALVAGPEFGVGAVVIVAFSVLALFSPRNAIVAVLAYTAVAAWIRRFVDHMLAGPGGDWAGELILLPVSVVAVVLVITAVRDGALRRPTPLLVAVTATVLVSGLWAFHPDQGSVMVGLAGLVFLGVPFLWFYVGRVYVDEVLLRRLFVVVMALALPAAIYGIIGATGRFVSWDHAHYATTDMAILTNQTGVPRPLGFATSPEEAGRLAALAVVLLATIVAPRTKAWWSRIALVGGVVLLLALLLVTGARAPVAILVAAVAVLLAVRAGWRFRSIVLAGVVGLVALIGVARLVAMLPETGLWFVDRQINGFADPLGLWDQSRGRSSLTFHVTKIFETVEDLPDSPLGSGTGSVTPAASRFGSRMIITESDVGNAAVAWGVIGLAAYLAVLVLGARTAWRVVTRRRDAVTLAAFGVLLIMAMRWSNGGLYSLAPLVWLALGWFDVRSLDLVDEVDGADVSAPDITLVDVESE